MTRCLCLDEKRISSGVVRTLVVVLSILLWFVGCAVMSFSGWLLFIDEASVSYYQNFTILSTALYVIFACGIVFLVLSLLGTCGATMKSKILIFLSLSSLVIVVIGQLIAVIYFIQNRDDIMSQLRAWMTSLFTRYRDQKQNKKLVDHLQIKLKCCGLDDPTFFTKPPSSCLTGETKVDDQIEQIQYYQQGCKGAVTSHVEWIIYAWPIWFVTIFVFLLQVVMVVCATIYLIHLVYHVNYEDEDSDEESDELIENSKRQDGMKNLESLIEELPRPRVYELKRRSSTQSFGFNFEYRNSNFYVNHVAPNSTANMAGITVNSRIIEINGLLAPSAGLQELTELIERADQELRVLLIDKNTLDLYDQYDVTINLHNVEGVTAESGSRPRLCVIDKSTSGFGFNLLYLEDRQGEFVEDVLDNGPAYKAGLKVGDRIVEVNGLNIECEKSRQVVHMIQQSGQIVCLLVVDPKTDAYYRKRAVSVTSSLAVDFYSPQTQQPADGAMGAKRRRKREVKPRYCCLVKRAKEEFGLYVVIDNERIGQVIRWVDCGGAADRAGLRIGDRIVEVNGLNVEYENHSNLIAVIGMCKNTAHFIVVDEDYDRAYVRNKPRLCRLFKEEGIFGFCIDHIPSNDGHYIIQVDGTGPAHRAGLQIGDRIIQINGLNVEDRNKEEILKLLRNCDDDVILLVIDRKSSKHYKRITQFKSQGTCIDLDSISIPEQPVFLPNDICEKQLETLPYSAPNISIAESISMSYDARTTRSITSFGGSLRSQHGRDLVRVCLLRKEEDEEHGFFLAVDRDRNGQIIQKVIPGGAADRCGLTDGDRIICINEEKIENLTHDQVVTRIRDGGDVIAFTVIDERNDVITRREKRAYSFMLKRRNNLGFGFYIWYDDDGHYIQEVNSGSPADKVGLRIGDRLIEINSMNIERMTHENIFHRIKSSSKTSNLQMLLVDHKTFLHCKRHHIDFRSLPVEHRSNTGSDGESTDVIKEEEKGDAVEFIEHEVTLYGNKKWKNYGFHLAFSNSFMGDHDVTAKSGHVVHWVGDGGPADDVGLRDGDQIVCVNGKNVEQLDHDDVMQMINENKEMVSMKIRYRDEKQESRKLKISRSNCGSFGFSLWFDENGHYIDDVTIGSVADSNGLKSRDRLLKINDVTVVEKTHQDVVNLIKSASDVITLDVISVTSSSLYSERSEEVVLEIPRLRGSYGFGVNRDDRSFYVEVVSPSGASHQHGLHVGDRILQINDIPISSKTQSQVIEMVMTSPQMIKLLVMSSYRPRDKASIMTSQQSRSHDRVVDGKIERGWKKNEESILRKLLGGEEISFEIEETRDYKKKVSKADSSATIVPSFSMKSKQTTPKKKKRRSNSTKLKFTQGDDNIAFVNDDDDVIAEGTDVTPQDDPAFMMTRLRKMDAMKSVQQSNKPPQSSRRSSSLTSQLEGGGDISVKARRPSFKMAPDNSAIMWQFEFTKPNNNDGAQPSRRHTVAGDVIPEEDEEGDDDVMEEETEVLGLPTKKYGATSTSDFI